MKKLIVLSLAFGFIGILSANAQTEEKKAVKKAEPVEVQKEVKKAEPVEVKKEATKKEAVKGETATNDLTASAKKLGSCCKKSMKQGKEPCCSREFKDMKSCCLKSLSGGKDACCVKASTKKSKSKKSTGGKVE